MSIEWQRPGGWLVGARERPMSRAANLGCSRSWRPRAFRDPFRATAARYGLPVDYIDVRFVNDHCYARMRPVGAPEPKPGKPSKAPPALVLKALARRAPRAAPSDAGRPPGARRASCGTRTGVAGRPKGDPSCSPRPAACRPNRSSELDDDALVDHLRRAADHLERGIGTHFELLPIHNVPVGRLLVACRDWGIEPGDAFDLLAGTSPASTASVARPSATSPMPSPTPAWSRAPSTTSARRAPTPRPPSTTTSPTTAGESSPSTRRVGSR